MPEPVTMAAMYYGGIIAAVAIDAYWNQPWKHENPLVAAASLSTPKLLSNGTLPSSVDIAASVAAAGPLLTLDDVNAKWKESRLVSFVQTYSEKIGEIVEVTRAIDRTTDALYSRIDLVDSLEFQTALGALADESNVDVLLDAMGGYRVNSTHGQARVFDILFEAGQRAMNLSMMTRGTTLEKLQQNKLSWSQFNTLLTTMAVDGSGLPLEWRERDLLMTMARKNPKRIPAALAKVGGVGVVLAVAGKAALGWSASAGFYAALTAGGLIGGVGMAGVLVPSAGVLLTYSAYQALLQMDVSTRAKSFHLHTVIADNVAILAERYEQVKKERAEYASGLLQPLPGANASANATSQEVTLFETDAQLAEQLAPNATRAFMNHGIHGGMNAQKALDLYEKETTKTKALFWYFDCLFHDNGTQTIAKVRAINTVTRVVIAGNANTQEHVNSVDPTSAPLHPAHLTAAAGVTLDITGGFVDALATTVHTVRHDEFTWSMGNVLRVIALFAQDLVEATGKALYKLYDVQVISGILGVGGAITAIKVFIIPYWDLAAVLMHGMFALVKVVIWFIEAFLRLVRLRAAADKLKAIRKMQLRPMRKTEVQLSSIEKMVRKHAEHLGSMFSSFLLILAKLDYIQKQLDILIKGGLLGFHDGSTARALGEIPVPPEEKRAQLATGLRNFTEQSFVDSHKNVTGARADLDGEVQKLRNLAKSDPAAFQKIQQERLSALFRFDVEKETPVPRPVPAFAPAPVSAPVPLPPPALMREFAAFGRNVTTPDPTPIQQDQQYAANNLDEFGATQERNRKDWNAKSAEIDRLIAEAEAEAEAEAGAWS